MLVWFCYGGTRPAGDSTETLSPLLVMLARLVAGLLALAGAALSSAELGTNER